MTCIVAITDGENVFMGADSAGTAGTRKAIRADKKIYRRGEFLFGCASSFRMGQLLGYSFPLYFIVDESVALDSFMCTKFVDKVREVFKGGGYLEINNNVETGGFFLVGVRGRIFEIESDFQVGEELLPFASVGCGKDLALGSLFSTQATPELGKKHRLELALQAAKRFSCGVSSPFNYSF